MHLWVPPFSILYFCNACLASSFLTSPAIAYMYTYSCLDAWSTKTVAYFYTLVVILPIIWVMNPSVGNTNWSTGTSRPGYVIVID